MARILKGFQFYLHTPRSSAIGMNHTCLCLPSRSWYSFTDPGGMEGCLGLGWGNCERVGKVHCIAVVFTITIVTINIVTAVAQRQLLCCVMLLEVSSAEVSAGDARG